MKPSDPKTLAEINRAFDAAGREQDFFRHLTRRCYRSPKGYPDFEGCAAGWAGELIASRIGSPTNSTKYSLLCLDGLLQQAIPSVYYITPELVELVEHTDVDADLTDEDFNLFTECALFLFPEKLFACERAGGIAGETYLTSFIFRRVEFPYSLKLYPLKTPKNPVIRHFFERSSDYNPKRTLIVNEKERGSFFNSPRWQSANGTHLLSLRYQDSRPRGRYSRPPSAGDSRFEFRPSAGRYHQHEPRRFYPSRFSPSRSVKGERFRGEDGFATLGTDLVGIER